MLQYPNLFSPVKLAGTTFKNRIFASPISGRNLDAAHRPDEQCAAFYERKARGGAASVCIGDCVVDVEHGLFGQPMIPLQDRSPLMIKALNRLSRAVTKHGAVMSAELQHAGLYANASRTAGNKIYAPVDGVTADGAVFYEMPEHIIIEIIEKYAAAAAFVKQCGFNMVTIHGGHGWLLSQFMSPKVNTRRDKWGGTLENRMRFPLAVIDAVRKAVGRKFPIEIRISGSEITPRGYDLDDGIEIAKALDGKVDLIHVSAGHHEYAEVFCVTHPSVFSEDSANIKYAEEIKKHVKTPVATVGAHCDPELMEDIIASGKADVIEIARALLADPDLPNKIRAGEPVRPCLRCLQCFSGLIANGTIYCAVNPEIGYETEYNVPATPVKRKKVLVAGGGIAGMQAAVVCAKRGHDVILAEASGELGGVLKCEDNVPFKQKIKQYIEYQKREIANLPIDVRLNTRVTSEYAEQNAPEVIIAAGGAEPVFPGIPGYETAIAAENVYKNPGTAGKRVVIIGGGLVGMELAIYLTKLNRTVTIVEMERKLNNSGNMLHQLALDSEIAALNIQIMLETRVLELTGDAVVCENKSGVIRLEADTSVFAVGQKSHDMQQLRECAPEFYTVGDCHTPRNIMAAVLTAEAVARNI